MKTALKALNERLTAVSNALQSKQSEIKQWGERLEEKKKSAEADRIEVAELESAIDRLLSIEDKVKATDHVQRCERMRIHALAAMRKNMPLWKDSNGGTIRAGKVSEVDRASQDDACDLLLVGRWLFRTAHITVPKRFCDENDVYNGGFFTLAPDGTFKFFTATAFHAKYQPSETDV